MYNRCTLVGRLARDPELKTYPDGRHACRLRIITTRSWRDRETGEMRENVQGHNVVIQSDALARRVSGAARKGDVVLAEGPVETRRWDAPDGQSRYITEIVVRPYDGAVRRMPVARPPTSDADAERPPQPRTDQPRSEDQARVEPAAAIDGAEPQATGDVFDDWESEGLSSMDDAGIEDDLPF